jgi:hypothetical protein
VRLAIVSARAAARWLDELTALAKAGRFVMTLNFYGAVGRKP